MALVSRTGDGTPRLKVEGLEQVSLNGGTMVLTRSWKLPVENWLHESTTTFTGAFAVPRKLKLGELPYARHTPASEQVGDASETEPENPPSVPVCGVTVALKAPVDAFFDGVMVNVDDPALRANRLALLQNLHAAMNRVADLARLAS